MAVGKTAGEIARRDTELKTSLRNAPGPGGANIYMNELGRHVESTADILLAMPPTVVGLF